MNPQQIKNFQLKVAQQGILKQELEPDIQLLIDKLSAVKEMAESDQKRYIAIAVADAEKLQALIGYHIVGDG